MANELDPRKQVQTIRDLLNKSKGQIALALPKHLNPDRMLRTAMTSIQRNPRLLECTLPSLIGGVIQSAQLGLELDDVLGQAYLVPFSNRKRGIVQAQFMVGYKGLIKLAVNSGHVRAIMPREVFQKDDFDYSYGDRPYIKHKPAASKGHGDLIYAYAVANLKTGETQFVVLDRDEIEEHRKKSRAQSDDTPWNTHYGQMAMKTTIRVLSKYLPASAELQTAASLDERAEEGIPQDLDAIYTEIIGDDDGQPGNTSNMTQLTNQLKQEQEKSEEKTTEPPKTGGRLF